METLGTRGDLTPHADDALYASRGGQLRHLTVEYRRILSRFEDVAEDERALQSLVHGAPVEEVKGYVQRTKV